MKTTPDIDENDILHAFSIEPNRDASTLEGYLNKYPQFREALIDLSIDLLAAPILDEQPPKKVPSNDARQAWLRFQSMLSPTDPASGTIKAIINPLLDLDDNRFRQVAKEVNLSRLFLTRLRDRAIQASTIPEQLVALVAHSVGVSVDTLNNALHGPPSMANGQRFKANVKPSTGEQITFEEAIENSGLTEEQKSQLKAM